MNRFDEQQASINLGGSRHPASQFLVAGAQTVATPLRSLVILTLGLFAPIAGMVWATLVVGPGLADAIRWPGAALLGPGGITLALLAGAFWPRSWAVVVEHRELGYKVLPSDDREQAEQLAGSINNAINATEPDIK